MTLTSPTGFAVSKTGTSCAKLNATVVISGMKYQCIKSGKKLVWGKGVKVVTTKPSPTPTNAPSSSSSGVVATPAPVNSPTPNNTNTVTSTAGASPSASPTIDPSPSNSNPPISPDVASPSPAPSATNSPSPTPLPSASNSPNLEGDGFPPNIPAPGRTCPNVGGNALIYNAKISCVKDQNSKNEGVWQLDPGEIIIKPTGNELAPKPNSSSNGSSESATPIPATSGGASSASTVAKTNRDLKRPSIQTALIAIKDIQDILQSAVQSKQGFQILTSPNVDAKLVQLARDTLPNATKFFSNVYDPIKPVSVIYSYWGDIDWAVAADKAAGDTPNGYQSLSDWMSAKPVSAYSGELGSGSHTGVNVNGFTPKIILVTSGPDAANRPGGTTTANHEYVHNVQQELSPTKFSLAPCWFNEGMAQYYGMALAYPDPAKYLDNRELVLKDREFGTYPFDSQRTLSAWESSLVANEAPACGSQGGYWIGPLAVEKLVSMKGTAGVIALIKEIERVGNFSTAFKNIYGIELSAFYSLAAEHIEDTVGDLLGIPAKVSSTANTNANISAIIADVKQTILDSKSKQMSPLIHILIEPGAMTADQEKWLVDSLQFISFISPPSAGGDWNLVFPRTMEWFLKNWDMSKEQQRYKDMFANNTAEQLLGSVHSYGTNNGGWAASFFVSPTKTWFNPDWQMRFMAQLLKPTGFSNNISGSNYPEWFTRMFAYPIGAAYSQLTSTGDYGLMRDGWIDLLNTLPKPIDLNDYVTSAAYTGPENNKMPGALADEILIAKVGIVKATNFLVEIAATGKPWDQQLLSTFGISRTDLYGQVAALAK